MSTPYTLNQYPWWKYLLIGLVMGLLDNMVAFYVLAVVVGLLGSIAGPAHQAMVSTAP